MQINRISPTFKGLIVSPEGNKVINSKDISIMIAHENDVTYRKSTEIITLHNNRIQINADIKDVIEAYKAASKSDSEVVQIKNDKN